MFSKARTESKRFLNATKNLFRKRTTKPQSREFNDNPFKQYIYKYGDRPRYVQDKRTPVWPFIVALAIVPFVLTPTYMDYFIQKDRKEGDEVLKDFEAYRKQRNAARQQHKDEVAAASARKDTTTPAQTSAPATPTKEHYKYVLVGSGTAAYFALQEIKKNDPQGQVLMISEEAHAPYMRPPLSKELWRNTDAKVAESLSFTNWQGKNATVFYPALSSNDAKNVTYKKGTKVVKLDVSNQSITTGDGQVIRYDKCLLATGGTPRIIPGDVEALEGKVTQFRNIDDFQKLDALSRDSSKNIVIVGGSYLGTELSFALSKHRQAQITQVFLEPEVLARFLPRYLCQQIRDTLLNAGVSLKPNRNVIAVESKPQSNKVSIRFDNGEEIVCDHVITCIGIFPNTELAENAGLEIDPLNGGIMTNSELESRNNVFVAGDVLSYHDPVLGRRRCEHYEHALSTGKLAGKNMSTAKREPFDHISMFWSTVGDISFDAVGDINSRFNTYSVWDGVDIVQNGTPWSIAPAPLQNRKFKKGIVYYLAPNTNRVVGVLLWNVPGKVEDARKVIAAKKDYKSPSELSDAISLQVAKQ